MAARKPRVTYHHGDLRRALLDAAIALVAKRGGAEELTLREAARRAGVSHSAPYRHFPDKAALVGAVAAEGFADLTVALQRARKGIVDDEARFVRTGLAYLAFAQARPGHFAVMYEVPKGLTADLQEVANGTFQVLKALAADAGITDTAEQRRVGTVAWSLVHGIAVLTGRQQVARSVDATPEALAELGLRHLFRSLRSSKPTRRKR